MCPTKRGIEIFVLGSPSQTRCSRLHDVCWGISRFLLQLERISRRPSVFLLVEVINITTIYRKSRMMDTGGGGG